MKTNALHKGMRLKKKRYLDALFKEGKSFNLFPLRVVYRILPAAARIDLAEEPLQVGVSASKRNFKRAVDRNRIKRLLREAYRTQNGALKEAVAASGQSLHLFFLYNGKELPAWTIVQETIQKALQRLEKILHAEATDRKHVKKQSAPPSPKRED